MATNRNKTMKKLILTFLLSSLSAFVFGQSTLITPTGDEILITKYGTGATPNILGRISGGGSTAPTATPANLGLLTLAGRGYVSSFSTTNNAEINFSSNQLFTATARGTYINFRTTADNTTSLVERMRINHNGNVGIGTNNPDSRLHLAGTSTGVTAPANTLMTFENNGAVGLSFLSGSTSQSAITFGSSLGNARGQIVFAPTTNDLNFHTDALSRMTIDGSGNVGIGTINPVRKLHINNGTSGRTPNTNSSVFIEKNGNNYLELATPDTGERGVMFSNPTDGNSGGIYYFNKDMYFNTNTNDRRMTILANGNVGIGTTTPDNKLDVLGIIRANEVLVETGWADYVFEPQFKLKSLQEVENFIKVNKHLPDVLSASIIQEKGLPVAKITTMMMQKIEELTLYMIEQDKRIKELEKQISTVKSN